MVSARSKKRIEPTADAPAPAADEYAERRARGCREVRPAPHERAHLARSRFRCGSMIRHGFWRRGCWSGNGASGRGCHSSVSPHRETTTISALAIPMIEASGAAALMTLAGCAPLLRARLYAASSTAITLSAITGATQKEARPASNCTTKALAERLRRGGSQHHSRLRRDRQRLRARDTIAAIELKLNAVRGRQPKTEEARLR